MKKVKEQTKKSKTRVEIDMDIDIDNIITSCLAEYEVPSTIYAEMKLNIF